MGRSALVISISLFFSILTPIPTYRCRRMQLLALLFFQNQTHNLKYHFFSLFSWNVPHLRQSLPHANRFSFPLCYPLVIVQSRYKLGYHQVTVTEHNNGPWLWLPPLPLPHGTSDDVGYNKSLNPKRMAIDRRKKKEREREGIIDVRIKRKCVWKRERESKWRNTRERTERKKEEREREEVKVYNHSEVVKTPERKKGRRRERESEK